MKRQADTDLILKDDGPKQVTIRSDSQMGFGGELYLSPADYTSMAYTVCGRCVDKPCSICASAFRYRSVALQQPFESVTYQTPAVFWNLFREESPFVTYVDLVVGYSAVLGHISDICDPDRFMSQYGTDPRARELRLVAQKLFDEVNETYKKEMARTFMESEPEMGRRRVLAAYEKAIVKGACCLRCRSVEELEDMFEKIKGSWELEIPKVRVDGVLSDQNEDFNVKHREWTSKFL